jgi:single-stranded DNA-binding protein
MIRVEFKGYVNAVRVFDWGTVYDVSHNQVRKNHQDEWETVGRDYFSVVAPQGAGPFQENDQVTVVGKLKTKTYDKRDGSGKGISLEVRADEMAKVERGNKPATVSEMQNVWPAVKQVADDQVPF